ncbi:MAG: hypothetical protein KGI86_01570, partial [Betaproteobacteria bacterium]|nr:hypothetical protein [Betaproteobacteria bacterium]
VLDIRFGDACFALEGLDHAGQALGEVVEHGAWKVGARFGRLRSLVVAEPEASLAFTARGTEEPQGGRLNLKHVDFSE